MNRALEPSSDLSHKEPLLATKLYAPPTRLRLVSRSRLLEQLDQGPSGRLVLVSAPAGFGKTTLLSEWLRTRQCPAAWVSLDASDNDPARFLHYMITALQTAAPGIGIDAQEMLRAPQVPSVEPVLASVINDIAAMAGRCDAQGWPCVLVLDDYHVIASPAIHQAMLFLLEHLPSQLCLAIATRADPPLPLARWRSRGYLIEIRADELRFAYGEAAEFLSQVMGLDLSANDVQTLTDRTEGWIAGLQMAALSLKDRANASEFVRSFSGSHRYILDYLVEEVLDRQPHNIQAFLLQTCILGRLCGPLCDTVSGMEAGDHTGESGPPLSAARHPLQSTSRSPAQEILEYLERSNLFVVPLDDERKWYRYHHLFAELLRARLTHFGEDQRVRILHARAAGWYEANGLPGEAIQHALAARDDERAARLIEQVAEKAWLNGEFYRLLGWIEALPEQLIRSRPWLCTWYAGALLQSGSVPEVETWISQAEQISEEQLQSQATDALPDAQALAEQIAALRSVTAGLAQDPHRTIELASRTLERSPVNTQMSSLTARCNLLTALGFAYYMTGELSRAEQAYREATRISREIGFLLRYVLGAHKLAHIDQVNGRLHQSYRLYEETLAFMQERGQARFFGVGYLYCGLSGLLYEWNRPQEARQMVAASIELNELAQVPQLAVDNYHAQARLFMAQRDSDAAQAALQQAAQLIRQYYCWPEVVGANESYQVRLWLAAGDVASASQWVQGRQPVGREASSFAQEWSEIARARILIAQGLLDEATSLLNQLARLTETEGRNGRLIEILALQAIAWQARNDTVRALAALGKSLALAEPEGYVRTFIDEGPPMAALLRLGLQRSRAWSDPRTAKYANELLAAFAAEAHDQKPMPAVADAPFAVQFSPALSSALVEPLSERELEVLRLLASGLSNSEIAEELILSVGTVKAHVHHIYVKLDVHGRVQAVARARELGLL
jgi:LuxR family maltose regulon positive regulatory protein